MPQRNVHFDLTIIRIWYTKFRKTNGTAQVLHYPTTKPYSNKRSLEAALSSPSKGSHAVERISASESSSREGCLKWRIRFKKTSFMCSKGSSLGDAFVLCSPDTMEGIAGTSCTLHENGDVGSISNWGATTLRGHLFLQKKRAFSTDKRGTSLSTCLQCPQFLRLCVILQCTQ